jgi:hypothetical protein
MYAGAAAGRRAVEADERIEAHDRGVTGAGDWSFQGIKHRLSGFLSHIVKGFQGIPAGESGKCGMGVSGRLWAPGDDRVEGSRNHPKELFEGRARIFREALDGEEQRRHAQLG